VVVGVTNDGKPCASTVAHGHHTEGHQHVDVVSTNHGATTTSTTIGVERDYP
jgi:hypothetical protein